jgi:hypothetical protein
MKLPQVELSLTDKLAEFDAWITPSMQEIQDTEKYSNELGKVNNLMRRLGDSIDNFASEDSCTADAISSTCIELIKQQIAGLEKEEDKIAVSISTLESLCSLLFMVTGKSDNNLKCQFPVYLAQSVGRSDFPQKRGRGRNISFQSTPLGRTIKSDKLSKLTSDALVYDNDTDGFRDLEEEARWLLGKYIAAILKDKESIRQFWALGKSYFTLLEISPGAEKALLAPIVIFKVRGSVSASGGHMPENILRKMMEQWGLERGVDFNLDDVVLENSGSTDVSKTRAYDFILPYQTQGWEPQIFIQCQFYAGDSGSVSHKVVDQTQASRPSTLSDYPQARFIEYLDGAGYYSSLNTDLQHMLGMNTTKDFIQVRSIHVKLRREMQELGFLTPIEVEHAIFRSEGGDRNEVVRLLLADGYQAPEVDRVLGQILHRSLLDQDDGKLIVKEERLRFSRRLMVIDIIAITGNSNSTINERSGNVLIPGYGINHGAQLGSISEEIDNFAPNSNYSRNEFAQDITWLTEEKFIILH